MMTLSLALGMAPLSDISLDFVVNRIQPKHIEIIKVVPKKKIQMILA